MARSSARTSTSPRNATRWRQARPTASPTTSALKLEHRRARPSSASRATTSTCITCTSRRGKASTFGWGCMATPERSRRSVPRSWRGSYVAPDRYQGGRVDRADFGCQVKSVKHLLDLEAIKNWGLSNENAMVSPCSASRGQARRAAAQCCIQNDMSLQKKPSGRVDRACHHFGVVGLPYGVLSGGTLTGSITGADTPRSRQNLSPDFQPGYNGPSPSRRRRQYAKLAEAWGFTDGVGHRVGARPLVQRRRHHGHDLAQGRGVP